MTVGVHHALSRALAFCCGEANLEIEKLFHRITWELHHIALQDFAAVAFVIRKSDGAFFVGRSRDHQALPAETLLGLLVEQDGTKLSCRVKDHALDTVRFIDQRFRTSILVRVHLPQAVLPSKEAVLWFGLPGGASPEAVAEAEAMGRELSQWFEWYGPVIAASLRNASEKSATQTRVAEMLSVLHDARAPLAVVRYLLSNEGLGSGDQRLVEKELEYLERLLGECAPLASVAHEESCDVRGVVRRVYVRYQREESGHAVVRFEDGYDPIHANISDLDLERIVTNILGNAVRYANQVVLSIHADEGLVEINVRDNGCGFTQATLDAVSRGEGSAVPSDSSGWGVGLASCRAKLEKRGGALLISSQEGVGSLVRIQLKPSSGAVQVARIPQVAEGGQREKRYHDASFACIVDDDSDQGESLARVLAQYGLRARVFSSLEPMLKELEVSRPSFILCDAHMPGGGAERLLTLFRGRDGVPIVAVMSGDASDDQQYRLAALGARAFFTKPVVLDDLLAWIDSLGPRTFSSAA